ncbi:NAD-dependent epimerase [Prochlorococcus marinus]|uniref:Putative nucleotide sugar epimerase n=1 Tax=Prochlorococcus marinus (strain MIT 9211) TaxID=93059 RepID=A9BBK3_PROM4|nr:NAD-dependent epimerase [Prochlorococcus marinus]ABX09215.1 Putative nucleotide sugar epimerase [Prochlorococcus marinus str. MIT 9211]
MPSFSRPFLVTGAAGFIGAALVKKLLKNGEKVIGIDDLNSYYDPGLKQARLDEIQKILKPSSSEWAFYKIGLEDMDSLRELFLEKSPSVVVNLAAQAGVRYSIENPSAYLNSNLVGFFNILELCRHHSVENLIYASSSSVYGGNRNLPFVETQPVNHPVSFYAATKKSNELMAHSYSHLYKIPATGLRFFTVYGPWGRPDMAPMIFAKAIFSGKPINIYNQGEMLRDFTYIDDIAESLLRCCYKPATPNSNFDSLNPDPSSSLASHRIFNIGNSEPIELLRFIELLEDSLGIRAIKNMLPMQLGDVVATAADTNLLEKWIDFRPRTSIEEGVKMFTKWYRDFYKC